MEQVVESREVTTSRSDSDETKTRNSKNELTLDRILSEIGGFGLYQIIIGIVTGVALVISSYDMFNFVFASAIPEHRLAYISVNPSPEATKTVICLFFFFQV